MRLSNCKEGVKALITSVNAEELISKKLELLGVCKGNELLVAKDSNGAVLVVIDGRMIALGKEITDEVIVNENHLDR